MKPLTALQSHTLAKLVKYGLGEHVAIVRECWHNGQRCWLPRRRWLPQRLLKDFDACNNGAERYPRVTRRTK